MMNKIGVLGFLENPVFRVFLGNQWGARVGRTSFRLIRGRRIVWSDQIFSSSSRSAPNRIPVLICACALARAKFESVHSATHWLSERMGYYGHCEQVAQDFGKNPSCALPVGDPIAVLDGNLTLVRFSFLRAHRIALGSLII